MVRPLVSGPSAIHALSVDGSTLDPEPSVILTPNVDGSTPGIRTIRDSCPQRGRFRSGPRTFREIDLHRGRFDPWYPHHPRFMPSAWTVPLWMRFVIPGVTGDLPEKRADYQIVILQMAEPSLRCSLIMEGPPLRH